MDEPEMEPFLVERDDQPHEGPKRIVEVGRYHLSRYREGAWEFSDGMLGATRKGPVRAFFGWLSWRREYRSKPPGYWAEE